MGCYVNPSRTSKEAWLLENGTETRKPMATETQLPVCLVSNGFFNAAAVAYNESELREFLREDGRPKMWFMVDRDKLYEVSDLKNYER